MEIDGLRSRILGLAGALLDEDQVLRLLAEIIAGGGGVHVEIDDGTRYKLIRRDGRFVLTKDASRGRPSTMPPRNPGATRK